MEKLAQKLIFSERSNCSNTLIVTISLLTIAAALWMIYTVESTAALDQEQWPGSDNHWLIVIGLSFFLMFLCATTPLPAEAITVANGMVFGPVLGSLVTWVSAMLSAAITFWIGRRLLRDSQLNLLQQDKFQKINNWIIRYGIYGLLLARLIPIVPFFALNIGAAFLPVSTRNYLLITGIGILPHIMIICFFSGYIAGH